MELFVNSISKQVTLQKYNLVTDKKQLPLML